MSKYARRIKIFKLDQKIYVAFFLVKRAVGRGPEHVQPADIQPSAMLGNRLALFFDKFNHGETHLE